MDITIQLTQCEDTDHITYVGPINEEAEVHLSNLLGKLGKRCVFNFKQVAYINSCGVRAWINFMRELERDREVVFEECTPEIVMQINMIPNFRSQATIKSVYAHFICEDCGEEQDMLFEDGSSMPKGPEFNLPSIQCESCKSENIEMDELEEEYFSFLSAA